jgi:translation initiation factor IF-3
LRRKPASRHKPFLYSRRVKNIAKEQRINEKINSKEVRVINSQGVQLGVLPTSEALRMAREEECDLVEVSPNAMPPVCRIMDYGKFKYQQQKKSIEAKKKHGLGMMHIKEIKLRPRTDEHDLLIKINHIKRFLTHGDKAKINLMFRGREISNPAMGKGLLDKIIAEIQDIGVVENPPRMEGRNMIMLLAPKT